MWLALSDTIEEPRYGVVLHVPRDDLGVAAGPLVVEHEALADVQQRRGVAQRLHGLAHLVVGLVLFGCVGPLHVELRGRADGPVAQRGRIGGDVEQAGNEQPRHGLLVVVQVADGVVVVVVLCEALEFHRHEGNPVDEEVHVRADGSAPRD